MKRLGWKLTVLIILAAIVFLWLIKAPIMASYLSGKMRVPVSIGWISMWPSTTSIHDFKIKNPDRFKNTYAFKAETTKIDYQFKQLVGEPSVIDQILIDNIYLGVECSNAICSSNNWTAVGDGMPKEKGGKEVIIHKLILTDLTAEILGLGLMLGKPMKRHVDRLEFNEIDSKKGFPTEELVRRVFGGAGLEQYIRDAFDPQKILEKYLNPLKGFGTENGEIEPK